MTTWIKQNATFSNILKIMTVIFVAGGLWVLNTVGGQVTTNSDEIVKVDKKIDKHIVETSDDLLTNHDLQKAVKDNVEDLNKHEAEITRINNLQIQLVTNQNILVANDTRKTEALTKMAEDIGKIKGKLNIE